MLAAHFTYNPVMTDAVAILKDRLTKSQAKVARIKKQLEAAEIEVSDTQTALRVLDQVFNQQAGESGSGEQSTTMVRQMDILSILRVGQENASTPADLFEGFNLISFETVNIDTFRTTLWRMKGKVYVHDGAKFVVEGDNGIYWKRAVEEMAAPAPPPPVHNLGWPAPAPTPAADANPWRAGAIIQRNPFEREEEDKPPF